MKSIIIKPRDSKEFEMAFSSISDFAKDHKRMTLADDDEISFVCLVNVANSTLNALTNVISKKPR